MKKLISLLITVTLAMSLFAYGVSASASTNEYPSATTSADTSSTQQESNSESEQKSETNRIVEEIQFEPFTAIDNDQCAVVVKEIDPDNKWGYNIKLGLENKSSEKTYMFSVRNSFVNGVEADALFATEIPPGKKTNKDISFNVSNLEENGITEITDIEIEFRVYDSNDWLAAPAAEEIFHIYPFGEDSATVFVREPQESDVTLAREDNVSIVLVGKNESSIRGYTLKLFIENKSDKELMVSVDEASVNGYMADPYFAHSVQPGKCAFTSMSWSNSLLEKNDITEIETIEFLLRVYDANDWFAPEIFMDTVTVNP